MNEVAFSATDSPIRQAMKLKVLLGALVWLLVITLAHVQLNVGWAKVVNDVRVMLGLQRRELIVGFLPVT